MKIKITITMEYEVEPKYYSEGATTEEMLATDLENINDDPHAFLDTFPYKITGEIIK